MASAFQFYTKLFNDLDANLAAYWQDVATNVTTAITPVATTLVTLYVILWGWSMMRGVISEPVTDGLARILRLALIVGIALNEGQYNTYLANMLWNSGDSLAAIVSPTYGVDATSTAFLDTLMGEFYDYSTTFNDAAYLSANTTLGLPSLTLLFASLVIYLVGVALTGYAAFLLVLAKMMLAIILGIGPMFILMMIFEATKRFFDTWLGQALNYMFLALLTAGVIQLVLTLIQAYLTNPDVTGIAATDISLNQALPTIGYSIVGFFVMMQLPSLSSALGGGVAVSTLGAVGWAYDKIRGTAGAGKDLITGQTLSNMRGARRQREMNARWAANNPGFASKLANSPMAVYRKVTGSSKNRVQRA